MQPDLVLLLSFPVVALDALDSSSGLVVSPSCPIQGICPLSCSSHCETVWGIKGVSWALPLLLQFL